MRHSIKSTMFVGAFLFGLLMCFTSCEDILGEWDKPAPAVVTPDASVAVTSITLNQTTLDKKVGDAAVTLTATVKPDDATDKSLTWSSDKPAVATVADGVVTIVGAGTAIIKATANDGSGVEATCTVTVTLPGLLTGKFTINGDATNNQVQFSQGNLQYTKNGTTWDNTGTWSFMENQWTTVETNGDVGTDYASQNVVSLFGWGTAGHSFDSGYGTVYQPWATNNVAANYGPTDGTSGLSGTYAQGDWGTNAISNGGNTANSGWRTLTSDEWTYLFNTRTTGGTVMGTASARYAHAEINTDGTSVKGIILFPDGVDIANSEVKTPGTVNGNSNWATKCTSAQWTALAAKGCVFLPVTGNRNTITVANSTDQGTYWSSSRKDDSNAFRIYFASNNLDPANPDGTFNGKSVRLVYDVQ